jgi:hypothetical protein
MTVVEVPQETSIHDALNGASHAKRNRQRWLALGLVTVSLGGFGLISGGFGGLVWSSSRGVPVQAPGLTINIDPAVGSLSVTDTVASITPGQYRERLVSVGSTGQPITDVRWTVSATVDSDATPSVSVPGDAVNAIAAATVMTSNATPALDGLGNEVIPDVAAGTGGLVVELWSCQAPNAWDGALNAAGAMDYWCDAATDGLRSGGWSHGSLLSPANAIDVGTASQPSGGVLISNSVARGSSVTVLLRTVFVPDVTTDGRQNSQVAERITLTHRVDAAAAEGAM